jgi:crotonobetainyl-CoA:carnitine CoA-transferase CaiB-like acyl-CoA transferase
MAEKPLAGIRVLDFTWVLAGPVATRILAALGAEVIKIERKFEGFLGTAVQNGIANDLNRDKLSVSINMAEPAGIELAHRLARISDIVMDNFSARVMRQWKMDYKSLVKIKPDIISVSMSGFGHTGPHTHYVSFGPTLQALTGFTLMMADKEGRPAGFSYSYSDSAGGFTGALAAMIALWNRKRNGKGQFVDFAQFEGLTSLIGPALLDISVNGRRPEPPKWRSQEGPAAPHGVYRCRAEGPDNDRWVAISVRSADEWDRFVKAVGSPTWASEPRFRTLYSRMSNHEPLDNFISQWTAGKKAEEVMDILQRAGVAAGAVANAEDACARDPHLKERGYFPHVTIPDGSTMQVNGMPFKFQAAPVEVRNGAHEVGADADYVLGELLGLSSAERQVLMRNRTIWL